MRRIPAEISSEDYKYSADFDAAEWFEQADDDHIVALADSHFRGEYPAGIVAVYFRHMDVGVDQVLDFCAERDLSFEVEINQAAALEWLEHNKPELCESLAAIGWAW